MGRGDKRTAKGKRCRGSYGKSRSREKIKARVKAALRPKAAQAPAAPAPDAAAGAVQTEATA
ncbi:MAG TPA: 30S ribosomal protein THX [Anaerohalosphaeraceae bacterium]|nr:30S ribosomal protein THX [Phycisphaerae bacterium]HOK95735.1 30S ribosomal protein THX [Anaerohalosphaeraceae bacterium]HOL31144.1 30S ribosomal protein THX [Anaerohalosphaeraceae bacterium]HOM76483.1 30S ribosomal protein THX [Anaerohalosphaeraceae bacterium]HPC64629.1 30S ribosomal protein THX [Anaerohalosphaeraceae bacterium]